MAAVEGVRGIILNMEPAVLPEQRRAQLAARAEHLSAVANPGSLAAFARASDAVDPALSALGLTDLGPLYGSPLSANVLRSVRTSAGAPAVLKLSGSGETGEAATLAAWTAAGSSAVPLLDHGLGRWVPEVAHLVVGFVDGVPIPHTAMAAWTAPVVTVLAGAHVPTPSGVRPIAEALATRFANAVEVWDEVGLGAAPSVLERLAKAGDDTLLHGDPVGMNLLVDRERVWLLDPAGVSGPAEFDAGRWVGRSLAAAGPAACPALIDTCLRADRTLRADVLALSVAVELVIEVRHRLSNPDMFVTIGAPLATFDADTEALVATAHELASPTA